MAFADRLRDFPIVLEVVPPHKRAGEAIVRKFVKRVQDGVRAIPHLAAINLPEVLDENHAGMPFYRNLDPRRFAKLLNESFPVEPIVNKVVVHLPGMAAFESWVKESLYGYGLRTFVLVGGASGRIKYPGPSVAEANRRLRELGRDQGSVTLGNILIPERPNEVERLLGKTLTGSRFFTTQVLFEPEPVATILRRYGEACAFEGIEPATVLLSFAPVADYEDVEFLIWLGAAITSETEERLLPAKGEVGVASLEVARSIWAKVRDAVASSRNPVPLGVNIEEISTHNFDLAVRMAKEFPEWRDADG
ncbi:MAG: hypothetical protein HY557_05195 [Euryarchaeota archaeon]|nr:hypothetical protein [Euryarchaeota archaeon]